MTDRPAHLAELLRHCEDLRDETHGHAPETAARSREAKEELFARSVRLMDPVARQVLEETDTGLLQGTGEVGCTGVRRDGGGGLEAAWTLSWPRQRRALAPPLRLTAFYGAAFHHPHVRGETVGEWPLNVFSPEQAAAEECVLRAIVTADLHNFVFRHDWRLVPAAEDGPRGGA